MDLNYLLGRHQFSLHRAGAAATPEARHAHRTFATGYAGRIRALQSAMGADARLADAQSGETL